MKLSEIYLRAAEAAIYGTSWRFAVLVSVDCDTGVALRAIGWLEEFFDRRPDWQDDPQIHLFALLFAHEIAKDEGL